MNALIWLVVAALAALGVVLTVGPFDMLPGSAQMLAGSGLLLVSFWLGLYVLRHRTDLARDATNLRLHDALALGFHVAIALGFFFVMSRAGWSPRLDDQAVRDSVTLMILSGVAWHVISNYWVRRAGRSDEGESESVEPPTFRNAMMLQVVVGTIYLGLNADRLPPLPPMMVANSVIQMLLLAAVAGACRTFITRRPEYKTAVTPPERDRVLPR